MKLKLGITVTLLSLALHSFANEMGYSDARRIMKDRSFAIGKQARLKCTFLLHNTKMKRALFSHTRPDCTIALTYSKEMEPMLQLLQRNRSYTVTFKIKTVSYRRIQGELLEFTGEAPIRNKGRKRRKRREKSYF